MATVNYYIVIGKTLTMSQHVVDQSDICAKLHNNKGIERFAYYVGKVRVVFVEFDSSMMSYHKIEIIYWTDPLWDDRDI